MRVAAALQGKMLDPGQETDLKGTGEIRWLLARLLCCGLRLSYLFFFYSHHYYHLFYLHHHLLHYD